MTKVLKWFAIAAMAMCMGLAAAADTVRYAYSTAKVTQKDGSVISQQWKFTYVNNKLRAKDLVNTTVISGPTVIPAVTYSNSTDKKLQADGSVVETTTRFTYTDGKITAKDIVSSKVTVPATPAVVKVEPPVVAPVTRYASTTLVKTLANGTVVQEKWLYTYVDNKLTAKDLVSTTAGGTAPVVQPVTAAVPKPVFDAKFNAASYYNNPNTGMPTAVPSFDPNWYLTSEAGKTISAIGANYAYARGWTGKGSTIMVMDTGIDAAGSEFAGKIKYSVDYTRTSIQDTVGHGSQVAAIAAAARDGKGMHGVAYDANLAIAKIGTSNSVSMASARQALVWAQQHTDIVVANLSANVNYASSYTSSVYKLADGTFYSNHVNYGGTNYYNLERPTDWSTALGKEMVLVVAAGNQRLGYVQSPAVFASAVGTDGRLVMNGQMIIAGGWNTTTNTVEGNGAGHICKVAVNEVCQDRYRTKDFFLMAPSVAIETVAVGGAYRTSSGTSFAAPAISGAVAVVSQLWPYMQGDQLAQLLFKTANKNIKNYNPDQMGHGLLDLNRATQPVGSLGVSVTGRTGTAVPLSGSLSMAGGMDARVSSMLSSVSAVDSFERDFTVNLSSAVGSTAQPVEHMQQTAGQSWSSKFAGPSITARGLTISGSGNNISIGVSSQAFDKDRQALQYQATVTRVAHNPWVNFTGMWGQSSGSTTAEFSMLYSPAASGAWAQAGVMNTAGQYQYAMVNRVSDIRSAYAVAGWRNNSVNLYAGFKPTVISGSVNLTVPTSVDADGVMHYSNATNQIRNQRTGFVGASVDYVPKRNHNVNFSTTYGQDGSGQIGLKYKVAL
jgi:hypothetical protein